MGPRAPMQPASRLRGGFATAAFRLAVLALVAPPLAGCGESLEAPRYTRRPLPIADVPEEVRAAAKKALPDINFEGAWKNLDREGKLLSYEVRGRSSLGKIREVRVSTAGEVLEME